MTRIVPTYVQGQVTWTIDVRAAMQPVRLAAPGHRLEPAHESVDSGFGELDLINSAGDADSDD